MMRACHLNTCPVGIATQDPGAARALRRHSPSTSSTSSSSSPRRRGRSWRELGIARFDDLSAASTCSRPTTRSTHWKARGDRPLEPAARRPTCPPGTPLRRTRAQDSPLDRRARLGADRGSREPAIEDGTPVAGRARRSATSTAPSAGCSRTRSRARTAPTGLPPGTIRFTLRGSAGQSFGAWLAPGDRADALSATRTTTPARASPAASLAVRPPEGATFAAEENVIVGNTVLYGATAGQGVLPRRSPASASPCATRARTRSSRASATTAAST